MTCNRCSWRPDRDLTCERHGQRIPARLQLLWHAIDKARELPEDDADAEVRSSEAER